MAIIYTYPVKANPVDNDLILISDSADSNKTKQIKLSSISGITLTTTGTSGEATLNGTALNIPNYSTAPSLPLNGIQYRNANGNFDAATSLIFESNNGKLIVRDTANDIYGIIEIQSDNDSGAELKIQGGGGFYTTIRGSQLDTASYNITLPVAGPGANNKILQSDSSGTLSWIDTPSGGSGSTVGTADGGTGSEITSATIYNTLIGNGLANQFSAFVESSGVETAMQLPVGNTSRRPTAEASNVGLIRYNTSLAKFEGVQETGVGTGNYAWFQLTSSS
jgi:hypothetical protein